MGTSPSKPKTPRKSMPSEKARVTKTTPTLSAVVGSPQVSCHYSSRRPNSSSSTTTYVTTVHATSVVIRTPKATKVETSIGRNQKPAVKSRIPSIPSSSYVTLDPGSSNQRSSPRMSTVSTASANPSPNALNVYTPLNCNSSEDLQPACVKVTVNRCEQPRGRGYGNKGRGRGAHRGAQTAGATCCYSGQRGRGTTPRTNNRWNRGRGGRGSHQESSRNRVVEDQRRSCGSPARTGPTSIEVAGKVYECPICMEELKPPIYQCHNGHLVCCKCEKKIGRCAECREDMPRTKIRNRVLEDLVSSMANLST